MSPVSLLQTGPFGCPRCTREMTLVAPWRYRCDNCDVLFEYKRAIWEAVERGVS